MWIAEWDWDEDNLAELARHGITPERVLSVWLEEPKYRKNKRRRAATHQMIGPDLAGEFWVVCIVSHPVKEGLWRAITGWAAADHEKDWWNRS